MFLCSPSYMFIARLDQRVSLPTASWRALSEGNWGWKKRDPGNLFGVISPDESKTSATEYVYR